MKVSLMTIVLGFLCSYNALATTEVSKKEICLNIAPLDSVEKAFDVFCLELAKDTFPIKGQFLKGRLYDEEDSRSATLNVEVTNTWAPHVVIHSKTGDTFMSPAGFDATANDSRFEVQYLTVLSKNGRFFIGNLKIIDKVSDAVYMLSN